MRSRLRQGEDLAIVARRHWSAIAAPFTLCLFLLGGAVAGLLMGRPPVAMTVGIFWVLTAAWASWRWLDWRADIWAVTTLRVIDESGVLAVRVIDSPLDKINNVAVEQSLAGRLLNFGTVVLQTAAESGMTVIDRVAAPYALKEAIQEMQDRFRYSGLRAPRGGAAGGPDDGAAGAPGEMKECPHCAERIKAHAKVCRYCGLDV